MDPTYYKDLDNQWTIMIYYTTGCFGKFIKQNIME